MQMAPVPVYQANAPSFDKAIFAAPGLKRQREGRVPSQPRFKKASTKKPVAPSTPLPLDSPDDHTRSGEHEADVGGALLERCDTPSEATSGHAGVEVEIELPETFNVANLLDFDPSTLGETLMIESLPASPSSAAHLVAKLEDIVKRLEVPIEQLVVDCDEIRSAFEPIADALPSDLKRALRPTAHLGFLREDVLAASVCIASRARQPALKKEIAKECAAANQLKAALDDQSVSERLLPTKEKLDAKNIKLNEEIKRLQQELSEVKAAIVANTTDMEKIATEKQPLSTMLKTNLSRIHLLNKSLVVGSNEPDRQIINSADEVRLKALVAVRQFIHNFLSPPSIRIL
ncbi:hypothetical protein BS78_K109100 [Paspalum vaginatum]|uniref:Uncharacterized protein n=1 Tax=Paspalum vaginatum TaxID=158149 RepID=A0A9W7XC31_9POAL|nr:hypothetical protein BS78_K109100 [Paspalum vaginatum]